MPKFRDSTHRVKRKAEYLEAVAWVATNDDMDFLDGDGDRLPLPEKAAPVTVCMIGDIYDVEIETVIADIRLVLKQLGK